MSSHRTVLGLSIVAAAGLAGCADEGGQILVVLHNQAPELPCSLTPVETGPFIPAGRIDAAGVGGSNPIGYMMTPLIKNIGDSQGGNLEAQRTVILRGARVSIVLENADDLGVTLDDLPTSFTAPFSGAVSPDGGLSTTIFEAVPAAVIERIGPALPGTPDNKLGLVTVTFTVFGRMNDGDVEADPYIYPVTVCWGCLTSVVGSCAGLQGGEYSAGGACNPAQDGITECCVSDDGTTLTCPAVPDEEPPA